MSAGLTIGAIATGVVVAALFWSQPLVTKVKMFALATLFAAIMTATRLSFGHTGGILAALIDPPSWRLLTLVSTMAALGVSIVWSLFGPNAGRNKK